MEWIDRLRGSLVAVDTAPLIYFIERNASYLSIVRPLFEAVHRGDIRLVSSVLTLLEVMIHPLRQNNRALADEYREILLNAEFVQLVTLSPELAEGAAEIRARHNLSVPDAIQLATAVECDATVFITNDHSFPTHAGIELIVLDHLIAGPPGSSQTIS